MHCLFQLVDTAQTPSQAQQAHHSSLLLVISSLDSSCIPFTRTFVITSDPSRPSMIACVKIFNLIISTKSLFCIVNWYSEVPGIRLCCVCVSVGGLFNLPQYKLEITNALIPLNIFLILEDQILPLQRRFLVKVPGGHSNQDTTCNS